MYEYFWFIVYVVKFLLIKCVVFLYVFVFVNIYGLWGGGGVLELCMLKIMSMSFEKYVIVC